MRSSYRMRWWERAMGDVEDPRGIELRDCRARLRQLEAREPSQTADAGASER